MTVLNVEDLTKFYGNNVGVKNLNFNIQKGEIFGIIGPNGAGKTTTIQLITGIIRPTSGNIKIDDISLNTDAIRAKSLFGLVPDDQGIVDKLSANEYVQAVGRIYGLDKEVIEKRKSQLFKLFDIEARAGDLLEGFSHGMRKKIQMSAGLINNPKFLIVDEPTAGLDPETIIILKNMIMKIKEKGVGILIATHNLAFAQEFCDRVLVIQKGEILAIGSVKEILKELNTPSLEQAFLKLIKSTMKEEELNEVVNNIISNN